MKKSKGFGKGGKKGPVNDLYVKDTGAKSFYIFGRKPVEEFLRDNPSDVSELLMVDFDKKFKNEFEALLVIASENKIAVKNIDKVRAEKLVGYENFQGVLAKVRKFKYTDFLDWKKSLKDGVNDCVLVLDKIEDVHNFGAILRTAAATGVSAVFVAGRNQAPVNGAVFKTSAGAAGKVKIIEVVNINQTIDTLKDLGFWFYGIDMEEEKKYKSGNIWSQKFEGRVAFVLGSEGEGISEKTLGRCDFITPIPMENDVESLNVSVAAAVVLYEWKRQVNKEND